MAISGPLERAILKTLQISPATLCRRAKRLDAQYGPMSGDEARWIIAHEANIALRRHGLTQGDLDRVRALRQGIQATITAVVKNAVEDKTNKASVPAEAATHAAPTPAATFNARAFHPAVAKSSRKLFVDGHKSEAIRKAIMSVNNRVRKLSGSTKDGKALMGEAFGDADPPPLQMTGLTTDSERDEHVGTRFLMMGSIVALRNPRSHEEQWEPDSDPEFVLEALALASMLHRFLDRCEVYRAAKP